MAFVYTEQQELIFSTISEALGAPTDTEQVITIEAVAGSSKSSSIVEATKRATQQYPNMTARYLIFGNAAAAEARSEFGTTAMVSTLHGFAHQYEIIKSLPQRYLPKGKQYISYHDIPKYVRRPFGIDYKAISLLNDYCNSMYTSLPMYMTYLNDIEDIQMSDSIVKLAQDLMDLMHVGKMPCTHSFYLKLFYINLLNGVRELEPVDLLIVDEAQDLRPITAEIIKRHPAKVKVLVGDSYQAVFGWMGCINAFELYPEAKKLYLSKSFRVNVEDAKKVQSFMRKYLDPEFVFEGFDYPKPTKSVTKAYLTRTNASLIEKMIELDKQKIPYHLATKGKIDQMFKLPLAIAHTKPGTQLHSGNPLYDVQSDVNNWAGSSALQTKYKSKYAYLMHTNQDNPDVYNAVKLLVTNSYEEIKTTADNAKSHAKSSANLRIMTCHTSKGGTFDEVELDDDVDASLAKLMIRIDTNRDYKLTAADKESLYLQYVAMTRARYSTTGTTYLDGLI